MTTRARAMPLDPGTSLAADLTAPRVIRDRVRAVITTILRELGPLTDDQIVASYRSRAGSHPLVPLVTPQRIRTARAGLVRDGLVHATEMIGFSDLGHRATVWGIV